VTGSDVAAVVVGAGAAGLGAAHALRANGVEPLVLEAAELPGGVIRSERVGDYLVERGPNTMLVKAPALALLRRLGLEGELAAASPQSRLRFLVRVGRLEPLPTGLVTAVRTPLLSARGKLRMLREPFVARGDAAGESVDEFCTRRLGREASEALVGPFLTGIYAGDERELGAEAVFPSLVGFERRRGSIVRGALASRRGDAPARGLRGSHSGVSGLGCIAEGLGRSLGEALQCGVRVTGLARDDDGWRVSVADADGEREIRADAVVLALPSQPAAQLLRPLDPELADEIGGIEYAPIVSISLGVDPQDAREAIRGFGFLVPRRENLKVLGCLFLSQLFPGRAPAGRELLTAMLGGVRWPESVDQPDDVLLEALHRDLERTLGLRGAAETLSLSRWPHAVPQPGRDHVARITRVRKRAAQLGRLALAGAWLDGVGVPDALASGLPAATALK
jgi:oxygen-dependent protoporphyrinogen oxidase